MSGRYLCLDCGLTATKAAVYDEDGFELAAAGGRTPLCVSGNASEIDMEAQWRLAARLVKEALSLAGRVPGDASIAGVGVSGHGAGLYPIDPEGRPVRPAFTSMDGRSSGLVEGWAREGRSCYAFTRHHPWSGQSVPQLRYLRDAEPADYERIRWVFSAKDWMIYRLTGEVSADRTDASNNALIDLSTGRYCRGVLETFGIPEVEGKLPPVNASADIVGAVTASAAAATGLPAGTPVVAGMFDVTACAVGSGVLDDSSSSVIAGTWNINSVFDTKLHDTEASVKTSLGPDAGRFAFVESSATSAGNLEWFLGVMETLMGSPSGGREELYRTINAAVDGLPPGADGVMYLPFIHPAHFAPGADAAFTGLRAGHGPFHMLRAVYEGVAFAHRAHLEILARGGLERNRVVLCGGAASSDAWCRIFADVLERPVETSDASQAGARGIAVAAAVGTGRYGTYAEAMAAMVRLGRRYMPDSGRSASYRDGYVRFRDVADRLATHST